MMVELSSHLLAGHSEQRLRHAFKTAQRDAEMQPVILFLDEVDALCPKRMPGEEHEMRVVAQLLTLLDGVCQWTGESIKVFLQYL